jgi:hypothetical protein
MVFPKRWQKVVSELFGSRSFLSHQLQRRLQPEVRTKTEGTPVSSPSPWIEWKISEISIQVLAGLGGKGAEL